MMICSAEYPSTSIHGAQGFQSQDPFPLLKTSEDPEEPLFLLVRSADKSSPLGAIRLYLETFLTVTTRGGKGGDTGIQR